MLEILAAAVGVVAGVKQKFSSWADLWALHRDTNRPFDERSKKIQDANSRWFQSEVNRPGADISSEPHPEADAKFRQNEKARAAALAAFGSRHEDSIGAELERRFVAADQLMAAAVAALTDVHDFQQQRARFARACHRPEPMVAPIAALDHAVAEWRVRVARSLEQPVEQKWVPAVPLVLD